MLHTVARLRTVTWGKSGALLTCVQYLKYYVMIVYKNNKHNINV